MNNTQSNTDMKNNSNCNDSLGYSKPKPRTVTFAIDTMQGVNFCGPNLRNRGNDMNDEHPSPIRNTKNQSSKSSNFHDSGNNSMPARRGKATMEIMWKPGVLNLLNAENHTHQRARRNEVNWNICQKLN